MAFTRLNFEKTWENAEDFPKYQDSEAQVRADLQYHPDAIRNHINKLLDELAEATAAQCIGDEQKGTLAATLSDIYSTLSALGNDIRNLAGGEAPEAVRSKVVTFTEDDWTESEDGWTLTAPYGDHGRSSSAFGYDIWCKDAEGALQSGTWAANGTDVSFDEESYAITLTAEEPYSGYVVFFGV